MTPTPRFCSPTVRLPPRLFLPARRRYQVVFRYGIEESRKPSARSTPRTRCAPRSRCSLRCLRRPGSSRVPRPFSPPGPGRSTGRNGPTGRSVSEHRRFGTRAPAGRPAAGGTSNGADRSRSEAERAERRRPREEASGRGVRKRRHRRRSALLPRNYTLPSGPHEAHFCDRRVARSRPTV